MTPRHVELSPGIALPFEHDCFNFAATLPRHASASWPALSEHTTLHLFWRADLKPLGQRQTALIDSLLATQDKHTTSAILWTNDAVRLLDFAADGLPLDILLKRYGDRLRVQQVDKSQLASGTPMEESSRLSLADKKAWLDGDLVRVLVLYQYGGIWVDMDSLATGRDLRVLAEHEWVTQWDCYGARHPWLLTARSETDMAMVVADKPYQPLNGALMHFLRHSPYLCEMLHIMATDPLPSPSSTDWGSRLYHTLYRRLLHAGIPPFKVLPWCFADGRSCRLDARLPDPFDPQATASFHPSRMDRLARDTKNAWVIHLHNQWDKEFPKGGWIDELVLKDVAKAVVAYESLTDPTVAEDDLA